MGVYVGQYNAKERQVSDVDNFKQQRWGTALRLTWFLWCPCWLTWDFKNRTSLLVRGESPVSSWASQESLPRWREVLFGCLDYRAQSCVARQTCWKRGLESSVSCHFGSAIFSSKIKIEPPRLKRIWQANVQVFWRGKNVHQGIYWVPLNRPSPVRCRAGCI